MGSFKEAQEMLLLCVEEEIIDDKEFILLCEAYMLQNLSFPHLSYGKCSIVNKDRQAIQFVTLFASMETRLVY